jgi:hypothetical protein
MKPTIVIGVLATLALGGCSYELRTDRHVVVQPPAELLTCPVAKLPQTRHLTDRQVARLISRLYHDNMTCKQTLEAVKQYLQDAQGKIDREET